jgi:hypothetical protein
MAVPDLVHAVAVEIHDAPAFDIFEPDSRSRAQRVPARRRERLVEKMLRVFGEQRARRRTEVLGLPALAARRTVDVASAERS